MTELPFNENDDVYEVVVYYLEPEYQVILLRAPSAEIAQQMVLEKTAGLGLKEFEFKSVKVINNPEYILN